MIKNKKNIYFSQIGVFHTPHKNPKGTPIQPTAAKGTEGQIEIYSEYTPGLLDLEMFSHIIVLYYFHLTKEGELLVKPFMDNKQHGVFATRASARPNPIGLSILELSKIEGNILYVRDVDIVDGTPLLDIKPYVPDFDSRKDVRTGWLEKNIHKLPDVKDDERFVL